MNVYRKYLVLFKAIKRLKPRMVVFMIRRILRNKLVPIFGRTYSQYIRSLSKKLPEINQDIKVTAGIQCLLDFYSYEYKEVFKDVPHGKIKLYDRCIDFKSVDNIDWNISIPEEKDHQMWRVKLAHMGFMCPMLINNVSYHKYINNIIHSATQYTDISMKGAFNSFWFPYAVSHRILALCSGLIASRHMGLISSKNDNVLTSFIKLNVAFLLHNIEHELLNNHVERNLAALTFYYSCVDEVPNSVVKMLEKEIRRLCDQTFTSDGVQVERSPMYQGLSIPSLKIMSEAPFLSKELRAKLLEITQAAEHVFSFLCHPDKQIALFNDSWLGEVPPCKTEYPDGTSNLTEGGYSRLSQNGDLCLLDAGAIGPEWNPGHGHADFLSIEVSLQGKRFIVDPGTSRYNSGAERARERSASAHNGPIWQGYEPVEFWGCFKVGKIARAFLFSGEAFPQNTIGGYLKDGPGIVGRAIRHYPGLGFLIADIWIGNHQGQTSLLIPFDWSIHETANKYSFSVDKSDCKAIIDSSILEGQISKLAESVCSSSYSQLQKAHLLKIYPKKNATTQRSCIWVGNSESPENIKTDAIQLLNIIESSVHSL